MEVNNFVNLRTPPSQPVEWTITHRDGRQAKSMGRTAWIATAVLGWAYMDIIYAEAKW